MAVPLMSEGPGRRFVCKLCDCRIERGDIFLMNDATYCSPAHRQEMMLRECSTRGGESAAVSKHPSAALPCAEDGRSYHARASYFCLHIDREEETGVVSVAPPGDDDCEINASRKRPRVQMHLADPVVRLTSPSKSPASTQNNVGDARQTPSQV